MIGRARRQRRGIRDNTSVGRDSPSIAEHSPRAGLPVPARGAQQHQCVSRRCRRRGEAAPDHLLRWILHTIRGCVPDSPSRRRALPIFSDWRCQVDSTTYWVSREPRYYLTGVRSWPMSRTPGGYKLIAIDLDGTLLCPREFGDRATKSAIRRCLEHGLLICFATGRNWTESQVVLDALEHYSHAVFVGGALVVDTGQKVLLHRVLMDPQLAPSCLKRSNQPDMQPTQRRNRAAKRITSSPERSS